MHRTQFLKQAFYRIARIRAAEQRIWDLSATTPPQVVGSVHLCAGQEAVPVGALAALTEKDQIISTYRGHGWALEAGLTLEEVIGEVCHTSLGINGGRGGSAYMMAPHRRFVGENSIVGAGVPMACGVAMANVADESGNVVLVSIGDGAMNQGAVNEAMAMAVARALPLILICENNGWAEMTKSSAINKAGKLTRRAQSFGMPAISVDGTDPWAVRDMVLTLAEAARDGAGPAMLECHVPRLWGHYNRDIEHYRPNADREAAAARDPLLRIRQHLLEAHALTEEAADAMVADATAEVDEAVARVAEAPPLDPTIANLQFPLGMQTTGADPKRHKPKKMTYAQAVNTALRQSLAEDPRVVVYGEDVGHAGGIFGVSRNLQKEFGEGRVFDTPIAESAILGSAVGAALSGLRPVVEIMWADFMLVALDQLINQAANIRTITNGVGAVPMVMRTQQGATPGSCAQHSQCLEALLAHIPGLKVGLAATPQDAYDMLRAAVADPDPCIIFEGREFYQQEGAVETSPERQPLGGARRHGLGTDAAIITWGTMVPVALEAQAHLRAQGQDISVLDLRWLNPLDEDTLLATVREAGGRVVMLHEANKTGGFGAEIVARLHEQLDGVVPVSARRVAMPDVRIPAAPHLMATLRPNADDVIQAVSALCPRKDRTAA